MQEYNKITEAQKRYIETLGGKLPESCTKKEASVLIDQLLNSNGSITVRQQMILRFWNKTPQSDWGKSQVSVWMDQWYDQDSDHQLAWELFKEEHWDTGMSQDLNKVPVGEGLKYLAKVKLRKTSTGEVKNDAGYGFLIIIAICIFIFLAYKLAAD